MQSPADVMSDAWQKHDENSSTYEERAEAMDAFDDNPVMPIERGDMASSRQYFRHSQEERRRSSAMQHPAMELDADSNGSSQGYRRSRPRSSTLKRSSMRLVHPTPRSHSVPWSHHRSLSGGDRYTGERIASPAGNRHFYHDSSAAEEEAECRSNADDGDERVSRLDRHSAALRQSSKCDSPSIRQTTFVERESAPRTSMPLKRLASSTISTRVSPPIVQVHDALRYLDEDSPPVTEESIRRSVAQAGNASWRRSSVSTVEKHKRSPSAPSASPGSSSSGSSGGSSNLVKDHESNGSSSPAGSLAEGEYEAGANQKSRPPPEQPLMPASSEPADRPRGRRRGHRDQYGTPEMPRGNAQLPHLPPEALKPRPTSQLHAMHLPRAEKLPLSGYELLAARLSTSQDSDRGRGNSQGRRGSIASSISTTSNFPLTPMHNQPPLKPIYRRFQALNHRLLFQLQDELSELEEQLHRLDTADTQTRRVQNQIMPASRRAESMAGSELRWHRADTLSKIGTKMREYNQVLMSFTETLKLPRPALDDVDQYRAYLVAKNPIAEIETRFLDIPDDLISLAPPPPSSPRSSLSQSQQRPSSSHQQGASSDDTITPMREPGPGPGPYLPRSPTRWSARKDTADTHEAQQDGRKTSRATDASAAANGKSGVTVLVVVAAGSVLVPVVLFPLLPSFMARMVVVLVMAMAMLRLYGGDGKSGVALPRETMEIVEGMSTRDGLLAVGAYGVVMAVIAGLAR